MSSNLFLVYYFFIVYLFYIINTIMARQRNNNPNNTISQVSPAQDKPKLSDRFNNVTSIVIAIATIFGFGYGTAFVVCTINHKMEIIELKADHQKELDKQEKEIESQKALRTSKDLTVEEVKLFIDNYNKNSNEKK